MIILSKSWWDGEQAVSGSWKGSCLSFVLLPTIFWKLEKVRNGLYIWQRRILGRILKIVTLLNLHNVIGIKK